MAATTRFERLLEKRPQYMDILRLEKPSHRYLMWTTHRQFGDDDVQEWTQVIPWGSVCLVCKSTESAGHTDDCLLAKRLARKEHASQ